MKYVYISANRQILDCYGSFASRGKERPVEQVEMYGRIGYIINILNIHP